MGLYYPGLLSFKSVSVSVLTGIFLCSCADVVFGFGIWVICTLCCKMTQFISFVYLRNILLSFSQTFRNAHRRFNNIRAMDPIYCFIKAYLIKAYIFMFFHDAPKISLSRICKAKSHPFGSSKHSCTVCATI